MAKLRILLPSLGLAALILNGCIITQAQVFANFPLPSPFTIDSTTDPFERVVVDLNTIPEYNEHKDKLKGLSDVAIVGTFTNLADSLGAVEVWITHDPTNYLTIGQVTSGATKLWGPGTIGASGTATASRTIGWDESAGLFNAAGKKILIDEALGDGTLTLYMFGTAANYQIRVENGNIILTLTGGV